MLGQLKVHLYNHHEYVANPPVPQTPEDTLEYKLFIELADHKVLFAPGWMFGTTEDDLLRGGEPSLIDLEDDKNKVGTASENGKYGHYRISFSNASVCTILLDAGSETDTVCRRNYSTKQSGRLQRF